MQIITNFFLVTDIIVSLLIILLVLMQRPKNEGLGAAFGGGMTDNLFGAQTTNVLATITRWLGGLFFGISLLLSILYTHQHASSSELQKRFKRPSARESRGHARACGLPGATASRGARADHTREKPETPAETGTPPPVPAPSGAAPAPTTKPADAAPAPAPAGTTPPPAAPPATPPAAAVPTAPPPAATPAAAPAATC